MAMEIEIISTDSIKPSSPTPHHLRTYKLSLFDQLMPSGHVTLVFFYTNNQTTTHSDVVVPKRRQHLKQSLSQTLTRFYPFAGKIKDDYHIDCNDEGAYYVEARVDCHLSQILNQPNDQLIRRLLPLDPNTGESSKTAGIYVVMIQVNIFACGGIAISVGTSHKTFDGPTYVNFVKAWAATARGFTEVAYTSFIPPFLFPQNHSLPKDSTMFLWPALLKQGKCTSRRFVFDASAIKSLKAKASSSQFVQHPTSIEVVSALIWKCVMAISRAKYGHQRPSVLSHAVNLRRRKVPPLPEYSIGNLLWNATACFPAETMIELRCLVGYIRESMAKYNGNFVREIEGKEGYIRFLECLKELGEVFSKEGADYVTCSSLCKLGFYETDFGWGKPMWVSPTGVDGSAMFVDFILFMETRFGDGIEAWVSLDEPDMALLEHDPELLAFASMDPSPLQLGNLVSLARL